MNIDIEALQRRIESRTGQRVDIVFVNYIKPHTTSQHSLEHQLKEIGEKANEKSSAVRRNTGECLTDYA
ncbi:hypothetical protein [Bacillus phage SBSphiJ5]|nr:hypothetical protein [Bacillus phage SBSphiJ5]